MRAILNTVAGLFLIMICRPMSADDGYRLWLKYDLITDAGYLEKCREATRSVLFSATTETEIAAREELIRGITGLTGKRPEITDSFSHNGTIIAGLLTTSSSVTMLLPGMDTTMTGEEGYIIRTATYHGRRVTVIAAGTDRGLLYGVFGYLRLLQVGDLTANVDIVSRPVIKLRLLNHWDNLDGTVERGYAGGSLWNWHLLPDYIYPRYSDYARANASVGINGTVLTNVNADALVLTRPYLQKVAALADVFRPYGIRVYLTARFSAPEETGALDTSDPLDPQVIKWWNKKAAEIYSLIPDFGGFLVKANSEGQPGPQNYGRTHCDGANMLADALAPYNGVVMWRAFVYDNNIPVDRSMQAYNEFVPLDGKFRTNVLLQVKNGPVDFQPREPFHPLFGSMPGTPLMAEFQITQEYLGCATHLVYLAPLYEECLRSDTYARGAGSTVARVVDGSLFGQSLTGVAGVANTGNERNWTGHLFGQANWFAFGRLAWDPMTGSEAIARDWIRMTISHDPGVVSVISDIMMSSRETAVSYMTPLGLHHIMAQNHHWGPGPWVDSGRADWTSVYYHRADSTGIGFDRTTGGTNAVSQYFPEVRDMFNSTVSCPENLLLWFHHLPWDYRMKSGRILWDELCLRYDSGVKKVSEYIGKWSELKGMIDDEQYDHVRQMLGIQLKEAEWWKDACLLYFSQYSGLPFPPGIKQPEGDIDYYRGLKFYFVPGI